MESFYAVGNEELGQEIKEGEKVRCKKCKRLHKVKFNDETPTARKGILGFYKCGKHAYIAAIDGKLIPEVVKP